MAGEAPAGEAPAADPFADAAAKPKEEESGDEEDALLDRVQALISLVVEQESDPDPRLIHTIAAICEDQAARHLHECSSDLSFNNTDTRGSHTIDKLVNLIGENDVFYKLVFCKFWSDTSYPVAVRCASARLLLSIQGASTGPAALSQLNLNEPMPPWDPVCKPAPALAAASSSPSCSKLNMEVKGAEIVEQDWVLLAKHFLRIAIYNISYMRGIFPEDYFTDVPELGVMSKMLMPIDADSRKLTDWVKQGVYDALEKKYLETLLFCINEKEEGPAIDEYAFTVTYPNSNGEEAAIKFSLTGNNEKTAMFEFDKAESIENLIRRLIRTCASFITNLDQMPKERTILMKIMYHDTVTPENYEPPFFECCAEDENVHHLSKRFGRLCVVSRRVPTMLLDSGATHHIFSDKAYYIKGLGPIPQNKQIEVAIADGKKFTATLTGSVAFENMHLSQVPYLPKMRFNVVSVGYLDKQGLMVNIYNNQCYIIDPRRSILVGEAKYDRENNDYPMKTMNWVVEEEDVEVEVEDEDVDVENDGEDWVVDSCCANHMVGDVAKLRNTRPYQKSFATPKGMINTTDIGHVAGAVVLSDVVCCPGIENNLISVGTLDSQGCRLTFYRGRCTIVCRDTLEVFGSARLDRSNYLYYLRRFNGGKKLKRKRNNRNE